MKQTEHTQNSIGLVLIAGLAGALTALLISPRSGKQNRAEVAQRFNNVAETATKQIEAARANVNQKVATAKDMKDRIGSAISTPDQTSQADNKNLDKTDAKLRTEAADKPYFNNWNRED